MVHCRVLIAMIRTSNAVVNNRLALRLRKGLGAVIAAALFVGASLEAAAQTAKPQWLLRADSLEISDRSLLFALAGTVKARVNDAGSEVAFVAPGGAEVTSKSPARIISADNPAFTSPVLTSIWAMQDL